MAITQTTVPACLNVVWGTDGKLRGAAYYEQRVVNDGDTIIAVTQGDAQPVALLAGQVGIDLQTVIGRVGADALALAERKDAELQCANADKAAVTAERDAALAQVAELRAKIAEINATVDDRGVPVSITIEQGEFALLASGKLDAVQRALDSLPGEQGTAVRIKWSNKARAIRRDSATVAAVLGQMLGMTDAEIDALFISAAGL